MALLSDQGTEIVIPVCAVIGIVFSLVQWFIVSKVKVTPGAPAEKNGKNGYHDYLIEEDGIDDQNVVIKCAEIQNAISEGQCSFISYCHRSDLFFHVFVCEHCLFLSVREV